MPFTYTIQNFDFFSDQVEEMGPVELAGAIEAFQKFPFAEQLKQAEESELTTCLPKITFKNDEHATLGIWAEDDKGFFLLYDNGKQIADFCLLNDVRKNPEGYSVEEFIELFFKGSIEQALDLIDKYGEDDFISEPQPQPANQVVTFSFSNSNKLKPLLWSIPLMGISIFILYLHQQDKAGMSWVIDIVFSFLWIPALILHYTYWLKDNNAKVIVNTKTKTIEYQKDGKTVKFNRSEIVNCEINEARSSRAPWNAYRYLFIALKDGRQIVITNFITEPETITDMLNLNFKIEKRMVPFLP